MCNKKYVETINNYYSNVLFLINQANNTDFKINLLKLRIELLTFDKNSDNSYKKILIIHINSDNYIYNVNDYKVKELTEFKFSCCNLILENLLTKEYCKINIIIPTNKIPDLWFSIHGIDDYN